jgi:predicted DNA-binding transcriptional regulator YafY
MNFYQKLKKIELIHYKIKSKSTGKPEEFSNKLNISRSTLYEYIEDLKELGAEIRYSRCLQTFYYVNDFDISIGNRRNN